MSVLKQIQSSTLEPNCNVAVLLRQCKVLGHQLGIAEMEAWVANELNGYRDKDSIPTYRVVAVTSKGNFAGTFGRFIKNMTIPLHCIPAEAQDALRFARFNEGVATIQGHLDGAEKGSTFQQPWPSEALALFGDQMIEDYNCVQAWKVVPHGMLRGVLDAVRDRVLDFALALQKEHPELMVADATSGPAQPPAEEVRNVFQTTIYGSVGALANASTNVHQNVTLQQGDASGLESALIALGVPADEVSKLMLALREDATKQGVSAAKEIGPSAGHWLGRALMQAGKGVWTVSRDVAAKVLPDLLAKYLGLPSLP